ncbi:MAG TPA: peptidoglycan DD-metalloendopeptidase family protein [Bryobacteraceae bacterium]|nr:peptidoglycan DD-metalloendopeptidase family protein [Bryobacteraceae bacterium]
MPHQPYFVVVLAHSLHGRLRRIHIPHKAIYAAFALSLVGCLSIFGFLSSYLRMSWKVSHYNSLRQEVEALRVKYQELQKVTNQKNEQLATLETFASEVSVAYGLKRRFETSSDISGVALAPNFRESLSEYNFLQSASISTLYHNYPKQWQTHVRPSLWPVEGRLMSSFGGRTDPFSGEGAIHTGVDLAAPMGTGVRAAADGIVVYAEWRSGYGRLVILDHGSGLQTYYGHLSHFDVVEGQEVRRGDVIAKSGASGRVTSPHLHYEVRVGGTPVNPYKFLAKSEVSLPEHAPTDLGF